VPRISAFYGVAIYMYWNEREARMLATGASLALDGWLAPGQLLCTLARALEVSAGMRTSGTEVACSIH
jgi:hypothetical protein